MSDWIKEAAEEIWDACKVSLSVNHTLVPSCKMAAIVRSHVPDEWVSNAECLPPKDGWYLVVFGEEYVTTMHFGIMYFGICASGQRDWNVMGEREGGVTHWRPLPDGPQKEKL